MSKKFQLMLSFFRGDHIVPNFEEIWPSKKGTKAKPKRGLEYYYDAMTNGPQLSGDSRKFIKYLENYSPIPIITKKSGKN